MNVWKVIFATLVIFGAGIAVGLVFRPASDKAPSHQQSGTASNPWQARNRELLHRMDRELALTPSQHEHIEKIMAASQDRTRNLWTPITQEMGKETQKVCEEIREELTPEQRVKFDTISRPRTGTDRTGDRPRRRGGPGGTNTSRIGTTNLPQD